MKQTCDISYMSLYEKQEFSWICINDALPQDFSFYKLFKMNSQLYTETEFILSSSTTKQDKYKYCGAAMQY